MLDPKGVHLFPRYIITPQHIAQAEKANQQTVTIFIGPEGDFTPDEVELAMKHGLYSGCLWGIQS